VLTITDNESRTEVQLNRAALERGSFAYGRYGNDVLVRFRVGGTYSGALGETFRFVSEGKQEPASASPAAVANAVDASLGEQTPLTEATAATPPQPDTDDSGDAQNAESGGQAATPESGKQTQRTTKPPLTAAARAVREFQPFVSEGIRGRIEERIVVPVTVQIDAAGRVVSASPEGDGDTVYRYLASQAARAAKLWRFEPARSADGTAAASTKTLHFVFTP
jgi:hypothetical protein